MSEICFSCLFILKVVEEGKTSNYLSQFKEIWERLERNPPPQSKWINFNWIKYNFPLILLIQSHENHTSSILLYFHTIKWFFGDFPNDIWMDIKTIYYLKLLYFFLLNFKIGDFMLSSKIYLNSSPWGNFYHGNFCIKIELKMKNQSWWTWGNESLLLKISQFPQNALKN